MAWNLLIGPVFDVVKSALKNRSDRKAKEQQANAAWEAAMGRSMESGWKDEYVTVVITLPLWQIFIGNMYAALTGDTRIILASEKSLQDIGAMMGTPYGDIMMVVVLAAVGIKGLKALK